MMSKKDRMRLRSSHATAILSFVLPAFLFAAAYAAFGIHPFGDKSVLLIDSKLQYVSFFSEYLRQIKSLELPVFSRFFGMGMNFYGTWAYYLSSPVNLLLLLFPGINIQDGMFVVLTAKIGLCGTAFYLYARRTLGSEKWRALLFSASYALCGFVVSYSDNMQWLDGVIWLPVLIMGIEKIYRKGNCAYYPFVAAILVISNFYISVMTGIFCLLYILYIVLRENASDFPGKKRVFLLKAGLNSLLGVGMAAFILLPVYLILRDQMNLIGQPSPEAFFTVNPLKTIGGLFVGRMDFFEQDSLPKIYSGLLSVTLIPAYLFSFVIKRREKIVTALFMLFVFLCFHVSLLNFVWHGLDYVGWFPYRYSFVLSFLILTAAVKAMNSPASGLSGHRLFSWVYMTALMTVCTISLFLVYDIMGFQLFLIALSANLVIIFSYFYLLQKKVLLMAFITLLLCIEIFMNITIGIMTLDSEASYADYDSWTRSFEAVETVIEENGLREQTGRTAIAVGTISGNDPLLFGISGIDFYSSAGSTGLSDTLYSLGYQRYISTGFEISDNGGSQLLNSLMGVSAVIIEKTDSGRESLPAVIFPARHLLWEKELGGLTVINNPLSLSTAYMVSEKIQTYTSGGVKDDPFALTDRLLSAMLDEETRTYEEVPFEVAASNAEFFDMSPDYSVYRIQNPDEKAAVTVSIQGKGENILLYLNLGYETVQRASVVSDLAVKLTADRKEQLIKSADPTEFPFVLSLGSFPKGEEVTIELRFSGQDLYVSYLRVISQDSQVVAEALAPLCEHQADLTWTSPGGMRIEAAADESGVLFVTVPYDEGWSALVNGEPAEILPAADAFIGIRLGAGENIIEMSFFPTGLRAGIYISLGCLAAAVIQLAVLRRRNGKA